VVGVEDDSSNHTEIIGKLAREDKPHVNPSTGIIFRQGLANNYQHPIKNASLEPFTTSN
jgi:hypothetical protein